MIDTVHRWIEVVVLLTVLIGLLRTALKKGVLLAKDVKKISESLSSLSQTLARSAPAPAKTEPPFHGMRDWEFVVALILVGTLIAWDILVPAPLSRDDTVWIAIKVAFLFYVITAYKLERAARRFDRFLESFDTLLEAIRIYVESREEFNKSPATSGTATPRAEPRVEPIPPETHL